MFALRAQLKAVESPANTLAKVPFALSVGAAALLGDQIEFYAHVRPAGLLTTVAKVTLLDFATRLNIAVKSLEEIEEDDPERLAEVEIGHVLSPFSSDKELNLWNGFGWRLLSGVSRELFITTVQRWYENMAVTMLPQKLAKSVVKLAAKSAERKYERYASSLIVAQKMGASSLKSGAAYWLAVFTVTQVIDTWATIRARPDEYRLCVFACKTLFGRSNRSPLPDTHTLARSVSRSYSRRLLDNFVRCGLSLAFFSAGAALGSCVKPGFGTTLGTSLLPSLVVLCY